MVGALNGSLPTGEGENPSDNCVSVGTGDAVAGDNAVARDVMLTASIVDVVTFWDNEASTECESKLVVVTQGEEDIKADDLSGIKKSSHDFSESKDELGVSDFGVVGLVLDFLCLRN